MTDNTDREVLEQEIIKRMPTLRPCDMPVIMDSLSMKTTVYLEDLLKRMKKAGR